MVTLFCTFVGVKGDAFSIDIDESKLVSDLKNKIKNERKNDLRKVDADTLQLFLAKKGDDTWLTQKQVEEGISSTSEFESLDVAGVPLNLVSLSEEDIRFQVTKEDVKGKNVPCHVLVVVPKQTICKASVGSVF
jgi:hypothetical protein